jgi:hypothetical protein
VKEAALLGELDAMFKTVGTVVVIEAQDADGITVCAVPVFEEGLTEAGKKPTGQRKTVRFYVLNRGLPSEEAFYMQSEPVNQVDRDVTVGTTTLEAVFKVYNSATLRQRTQAAMIDAAFDIMNEAPATADHAKRMAWSADVMKDLPKMLNTMMVFVSQNATVQAAGGAATDNDLTYIVVSSIPFTFTLYGY